MDPRWSQPPPAWQPPPYQGWQDPNRQSGLLKASRILLLVGSILAAVGAGFLLLMATFMGLIFGSVSDGGAGAFGIVFVMYGIFALFLGAGAICGFVAWKKTPGDLDAAFVWGLVGAILQGVNVVTLLGAIFAKACPEAEAAAARRRQGWAMPPQAR